MLFAACNAIGILFPDDLGVIGVKKQGQRSALLTRNNRAASPDTYGRPPDLVFHGLDGTGISVDPAVEGHAIPFVRWA